MFYLVAPLVAGSSAEPLTGAASQAHYAGAAAPRRVPGAWRRSSRRLSTAVAVHARRCSRSSSLIAWRAVASRARGSLYFIAAFFAIATQAVWSAVAPDARTAGTAVAIYVAFGVVSLGVPLVARRTSRPLEPAWGGGAVLLLGLGCCSFSRLRFGRTGRAVGAGAASRDHQRRRSSSRAPRGAARRLAGRQPAVVGRPDDAWWSRAAGSVGVLPSLLVVVGLDAGDARRPRWSLRNVDGAGAAAQAPFARGLYLGLVGHFFLFCSRPTARGRCRHGRCSRPSAAMTLAHQRRGALEPSRDHACGRHDCRGRGRRAGWSARAGTPEWGLTAVLAAAAVSGYALRLAAARRPFHGRRAASRGRPARRSSSASCRSSPLSTVGRCPPSRCCSPRTSSISCVLLALTAKFRWPFVAVGAVVPAWVAVLQWQAQPHLTVEWPKLLTMSVALYAVFAAYPFVVGRRARDSRDPYLAAVLASAMAFFGARAAFVAGELDWMIGAIPVIEGAVLARDVALAAEPRVSRSARPGRVSPSSPVPRWRLSPSRFRCSCSSSGSRSAGRSKARRWRGSTRGFPIAGSSTRALALLRRGVRPAGAQSRGARLRAARLDAHLQLVSLHLPRLRRGPVRRRAVPVEDERSASPEPARLVRCSRAPPSSCCSCCSISRSPTSTRPDRRSCSGSASPSRRI